MSNFSYGDLSGIFASPITGHSLDLGYTPLRLSNGTEEFLARDGVFVFLPKTNEAYEGAYLNKIKYIPRKDIFPFTIPLWMVSHGYVWEVRKQFLKGAVLCELGCASGVNYFGQQFNMVGVDFSLASLQSIENYKFRIQANAIALPFRNESLDGIISSFFWEHIAPAEKEIMLQEFHRVLKPGGKVVMLYDIETNNKLIGKLKQQDLAKYEELFLQGDYHIGYETMKENRDKFTQAGFTVVKHFGMERTMWLSNSAYTKLATQRTGYGRFSRFMQRLTSKKIPAYLHMLSVRILDETIGQLIKQDRSRIALSVLQR